MEVMIRRFEPGDEQLILNFAYRREKENMFIIGSFEDYPEPFEQNIYLGCYDGDELIGIGTFFEKRFRSLVINAQNDEALNELVDAFVLNGAKIEWVPTFKRYGLPTVKKLQHHGIEPKQVTEETVFLLTKDCFNHHPSINVVKAVEEDMDEIILLDRAVESEDLTKPITNKERRQIVIGREWILRIDNIIVSKTSIHGVSQHNVQIGGVATHPDHQSKGYAKQIVSSVCSYWLQQEKDVLLFCRNNNIPALKVYNALGFRPIDEFIIAKY